MWELHLPEEGRIYTAVELANLPLTEPDPAQPLQFAVEIAARWQQSVDGLTFSTSGSTGVPKPIYLTRGQLLASAQATIAALELGANDVLFCPIHTRFVGGALLLIRAAVLGVPCVVVTPSRDAFLSLENHEAITFASLTPLQLPGLASALEQGKFPQLRHVLIGGASLSAEQLAQVQTLPVAAWHTFGMTETASHVALRKLNGPDAQQDYHLLPGINWRQDADGALQLCGAVTGNQWLATHDVVQPTGPDSFIWIGRKDFVINSGGVKIHPEEDEARLQKALTEAGITTDLALTWLPDAALGQRLVLVVFSDVNQDQVMALAQHSLPAYHAPKAVSYCAAMPTTPGGKLDRGALQRWVAQAAL